MPFGTRGELKICAELCKLTGNNEEMLERLLMAQLIKSFFLQG